MNLPNFHADQTIFEGVMAIVQYNICYFYGETYVMQRFAINEYSFGTPLPESPPTPHTDPFTSTEILTEYDLVIKSHLFRRAK